MWVRSPDYAANPRRLLQTGLAAFIGKGLANKVEGFQDGVTPIGLASTPGPGAGE